MITNGFELGDVASSSSSSSSSAPPPPRSDAEDDGGGGSDREIVDRVLAEEIRTALHLAVGKICRAEDDATAADEEEAVVEIETEMEVGGAGHCAFSTSDDAVAALTDLTYHYATSLFANDLVAFSRHAKRRTVRTDDVLLMARKDRGGMLADLERVMEERPERYGEGSRTKNNNNAKGGGTGGRRRSKSTTSGGTTAAARRKRASAKGGARRSGIDGSKRRTSNSRSMGDLSSSSSSSSSDDDDDGGVRDPAIAARRERLQLERNNLHDSAFARGGDSKTAKRNDVGGRGFKIDNDESSGGSDDEFEFGALNKKEGAIGAGASRRKASPTREDGSSTDSGKDRGSGGRRKSGAMLRIDRDSSEEDDDNDNNNMVIDLASD